MSSPSVTVVIPVYGDWPSLKDCIASLKEHLDTSTHQVMLVNDCGPDVEMLERNIKEAITGTNFLYFRNAQNMGFVETCNRAVLELDKTHNDILSLNSDTKVTDGFLEEMLQVLYSSDSHGAVSPRSNSAAMCTFPLAAREQGIDADTSYALFKRYNSTFPRYSVVPTAHGFCILIRRTIIKEHGLFDKSFGKGYGEEVDFCMRIKQHGYRSVLCNRAYVFHLETRSFSLEDRAQFIEQHNQIVWARHPDFRQSVRDYMAEAIPREEELLSARRFSQGVKRLLKPSPIAYNLARKLAQLVKIVMLSSSF